jgi:hypothetical protein
MQQFKNTAAQGEITINYIEKLPNVAMVPLALEGGQHVIGHSETGHHHVLERAATVFVAKDAPAGMRILYAILDEANALVHERGFDTHETIALQPGMYEFRVGRMYDPYEAVARQQAD